MIRNRKTLYQISKEINGQDFKLLECQEPLKPKR